MPFCVNCGKEATPGAVFCASCGKPLQGEPQATPYYQPSYYSRKEEAIAAILSLIIPGVGQMYVGRILRGIVIFLIPPIFGIFVFLPILFGSFVTTVISRSNLPSNMGIQAPAFFLFFPGFIFFGIILWLVFLIWNVFDAYNLARTYNYHLMNTGRPPW
jgi:TM2 domain-containing membrane protein YozV